MKNELVDSFVKLKPYFDFLEGSRYLRNSKEFDTYFELYNIREMHFITDRNFNELKKQLERNKNQQIIQFKGAAGWRNQRETSRLIFNYLTSACAFIEKYLDKSLNKKHDKVVFKYLAKQTRNYLIHYGELPLKSFKHASRKASKEQIVVGEKIDLQRIKEKLSNRGNKVQKGKSLEDFDIIEKKFGKEIFAREFFHELHVIIKLEYKNNLLDFALRHQVLLSNFEKKVTEMLMRFEDLIAKEVIPRQRFEFPISESQLRGLRCLLR